MSKTKMTSLFCTGNTIHSDVLDVQNLPQKSKKQSTPPPNINCANNKREVNKCKHIVLSLLIVVATMLLVACSEPTKDKGSTPPTIATTKPTTPIPTKQKPATTPTVRTFLHTLSKSIEEIEKGRINPQTWQAGIKNLLQQLKKKPTYKHKPTTKKELIVLIKAEIWAQGTGGAPNWKANLNNIDTSLIIDMAYLFSKTKDGYGLHQFSGSIKDWDVSSVTSLAYMFYNAFSFNQSLNDWDEHLKNTDDTYRKVNTQDMFKG